MYMNKREEIKRPNIRLKEKALSTYCFVRFFCWTIADPIPVSEKEANTVVIAVIAA